MCACRCRRDCMRRWTCKAGRAVWNLKFNTPRTQHSAVYLSIYQLDVALHLLAAHLRVASQQVPCGIPGGIPGRGLGGFVG